MLPTNTALFILLRCHIPAELPPTNLRMKQKIALIYGAHNVYSNRVPHLVILALKIVLPYFTMIILVMFILF